MHIVHKKWNIQIEADKKLVTVIVGLFSLRENAPTKNVTFIAC